MFTSITFFTSIDAACGFAGEDYAQAVVEENARRALNKWDERVSHYDVAVDLPLLPMSYRLSSRHERMTSGSSRLDTRMAGYGRLLPRLTSS
jgi:hypothetical protein